MARSVIPISVFLSRQLEWWNIWVLRANLKASTVNCSFWCSFSFSFWAAHTFRVRSFQRRHCRHQEVAPTGANVRVFAVQFQVSSCEEIKSHVMFMKKLTFCFMCKCDDWLTHFSWVRVCPFNFFLYFFKKKNICKET